MSFFEDRLPDCFSFGARGGPMFSTEVVDTQGGQQYANQNWTMPLHMYDVSEAIKTKSDFASIRAFFYTVKGRADGFRFKDWGDFEATAESTIAIVAGSTFQLRRDYVFGSRTFHRTIYKPVTGTVTVYRTRSGSTSAITASVSYSTGVVTVTGHAGGDIYTWTGQFDVPVRFTSDMMESVIENKSDGEFLIRWPSIQVREFRPPA